MEIYELPFASLSLPFLDESVHGSVFDQQKASRVLPPKA